ncbi:hypothetical protein G4B88_002920 [Cannabis sativa]|uniref:Uncharacterized protein n=1 Tax=Cannabis sativa TaxID=3483 RepID=A0A7J6GHL4_CANSA|nr:hypothetical protein G4B88_002920 [Cannabis sativa]
MKIFDCNPQYHMEKEITVKATEDASKEFTTKEDVAIVLISQYNYELKSKGAYDMGMENALHSSQGAFNSAYVFHRI